MIRMIIMLMFSITFLMASDNNKGYKVFKDKCSTCHAETMTKEEALKNFKNLKAPPMIEVSNKLKDNIKIVDNDSDVKRRVVIAFVKDYITSPSVQYSMCDPIVLEKLGTMPSLKGKITEKQKQDVAEWLYDYYEGKTF